MKTESHNEQHHDMLDYAWDYFSLHSSQRISIFNFFLVLSIFVAAGLAACLQRGGRYQFFGAALGVLLMGVSFVFWKLDQRTSFLIKHAEAALSELEQSFPIHAAHLVSREAERTEKERSDIHMWTYGAAFRLVFGIMGFVGFAGSIWCALLS